MTTFDTYLITRLDKIIDLCCCFKTLTCVIAVLSTIICIISFVVMIGNKYNHYNHIDSDYAVAAKLFNLTKWISLPTIVSFIFFSICGVLIPSTKEMIAIKVIPTIASEENCKKVTDISKDFLDVAAKWLNDIKIEKKKEQ